MHDDDPFEDGGWRWWVSVFGSLLIFHSYISPLCGRILFAFKNTPAANNFPPALKSSIIIIITIKRGNQCISLSRYSSRGDCFPLSAWIEFLSLSNVPAIDIYTFRRSSYSVAGECAWEPLSWQSLADIQIDRFSCWAGVSYVSASTWVVINLIRSK